MTVQVWHKHSAPLDARSQPAELTEMHGLQRIFFGGAHFTFWINLTKNYSIWQANELIAPKIELSGAGGWTPPAGWINFVKHGGGIILLLATLSKKSFRVGHEGVHRSGAWLVWHPRFRPLSKIMVGALPSDGEFKFLWMGVSFSRWVYFYGSRWGDHFSLVPSECEHNCTVCSQMHVCRGAPNDVH